jgi:hypothetical protein
MSGEVLTYETTPHGGRIEHRHVTEDVFVDRPRFGFRVRWDASDYTATFTVYEITELQATDDDLVPMFERKGTGTGTVASIDEAEPYFAGHVKWDGCANLDGFAVHTCEPMEWKLVGALLKYLWGRAVVLMHRDGEIPPWPEEEPQP